MSEDILHPRNEVAHNIESQFMVGGVWMITKEEERTSKLLKEAVSEIDRLQNYIDTFESTVEEAVEDRENELIKTISVWRERDDIVYKEARKLRNTAQTFVSQFDKMDAPVSTVEF